MRRARRPVAVAAVAMVAVLAGCGGVYPGAAAVVDGETIPLDEVDELARAVCSAQVVVAQQDPTQLDPNMAVYRNSVLSTLVNDRLASAATDELGIEVPPAAYERDLSEFEEIFAALSEEEESSLREFLVLSRRLQVATRLIGQQVGGEQAAANPQVADSAGLQYLVDEAASADVELDPRFGELTSGQVVGGSGSLSVPLEGADARPDGGLPAAQTCD